MNSERWRIGAKKNAEMSEQRDQRVAIRALLEARLSVSEVARQTGTSRVTVTNVRAVSLHSGVSLHCTHHSQICSRGHSKTLHCVVRCPPSACLMPSPACTAGLCTRRGAPPGSPTVSRCAPPGQVAPSPAGSSPRKYRTDLSVRARGWTPGIAR